MCEQPRVRIMGPANAKALGYAALFVYDEALAFFYTHWVPPLLS